MPSRRRSRVRTAFTVHPDADRLGYRVVNGENDGLPGLIVDRYAGTLVVKLYTAALFRPPRLDRRSTHRRDGLLVGRSPPRPHRATRRDLGARRWRRRRRCIRRLARDVRRGRSGVRGRRAAWTEDWLVPRSARQPGDGSGRCRQDTTCSTCSPRPAASACTPPPEGRARCTASTCRRRRSPLRPATWLATGRTATSPAALTPCRSATRSR